MDIFESIFGKVVNRWERRKASLRQGSRCLLKDLEPYLTCLVDYILAPHPQKIRLMPAALPHVGFVDDTLLLPAEIDFFSKPDMNRQLYLHLVFVAAAAQKIGLSTRMAHGPDLRYLEESLNYLPLINRTLDEMFPHFSDFQSNLVFSLDHALTQNVLSHRQLINLARPLLLRRQNQQKDPDTVGQNGPNFASFKDNHKLPIPLACLVPRLPQKTILPKLIGDDTQTQSRHRQEKPTTEIEKTGTASPEYVDLEKEKKQTNPVTHSFEKMETADEYQGGYRLDSGDDELLEHQQALSELDLKKVTRGGEAAHSIFRADLPGHTTESTDVASAFSHEILLPEWFRKSRSYRQDYCRLKIGLTPPASPASSQASLRDELMKIHGPEIARWKKQIEMLQNQYQWRPRQPDGQDIDLDAFVRTVPNILMKTPLDERLYVKQRRQMRACELFVIVDQSLSADAWVNNRRVIDVCVESLGLMGLLFEDLEDRITVATTWSHTRKNCHIQIYKLPDSSWSTYFNTARQITPQGYTRLGPAIRYATQALNRSYAAQKILILLTDGKPTDLDGYEGTHGIDDIRQAYREAKKSGIYTIAYAIDSSSKHFFPQMFERFEILAEPGKLPHYLFQLISHVFLGSIAG